MFVAVQQHEPLDLSTNKCQKTKSRNETDNHLTFSPQKVTFDEVHRHIQQQMSCQDIAWQYMGTQRQDVMVHHNPETETAPKETSKYTSPPCPGTVDSYNRQTSSK